MRKRNLELNCCNMNPLVPVYWYDQGGEWPGDIHFSSCNLAFITYFIVSLVLKRMNVLVVQTLFHVL